MTAFQMYLLYKHSKSKSPVFRLAFLYNLEALKNKYDYSVDDGVITIRNAPYEVEEGVITIL